jgi:uncharacterized membrane protein YozB (DUF420 family)
MTFEIFLKILLWNLTFTLLALAASVGIYFILDILPIKHVEDLPIYIFNPLTLFGIVLMGQLYFNAWLLEKRRIYNLRNLIYCFFQLLLLWVVLYIFFAALFGE